MSKAALILGVPHQLQGPSFRGYIDDPSYGILLQDLIQHGVDFVFEEATGRRPSTAEKLTESVLGAGHHLDVDPPVNERAKYGIAKITGGGGPIDPSRPIDVYESALVEEQRKREELWLQRIQTQPFSKALIVVGLAHALSIAFRLVSAGVGIPEVRHYVPYHKFCTRPHS